MLIKDHRLQEWGHLKPVWIPDEWGGKLPDSPRIAVIHYGVTMTAYQTASVLKGRDYVSAHICIDRHESVIQQIPLDRVGYHAGNSEWHPPGGGPAKPHCNRFSIGIEIANPGPLERRRDGNYYTTFGVRWEGPVHEEWHRNDTAHRGWHYWAGYSAAETDLCAHLCELLRQTYGLDDIVGHDEIAPGRKMDPGPAFPIGWLRKTVLGK